MVKINPPHDTLILEMLTEEKKIHRVDMQNASPDVAAATAMFAVPKPDYSHGWLDERRGEKARVML